MLSPLNPSSPNSPTKLSKPSNLTSGTVSVIIPCYNGASTIGDALNSLILQTYKNWEAIVVDDGSVDGSLNIIKQFAARDSRIRFIHISNQGVSAARNVGIGESKGEFLNFLDADDLLLPEMLGKMVRKLGKHGECGAAVCGWVVTDEKLKHWNSRHFYLHHGKLFQEIVRLNTFQPNTLLLRKNILTDTGLFDHSLAPCADWDMWIRIARKGTRFISVPEVLAVYRMVTQSMIRHIQRPYNEGMKVIDRGFSRDDRVKNPDPEFAQGDDPFWKRKVQFHWVIRCCAFAVAAGETEQALQFVEKAVKDCDGDFTPERFAGFMEWPLWFACNVPRGEWDALIPKLGFVLMNFLSDVELRLSRPGFALDFMRIFLGGHKNECGQELLRLLFGRMREKFFSWIPTRQERLERSRKRFVDLIRKSNAILKP
ncbi:MAG: glycosyltransferase [Chlamydiota bacterium]|nr:glycosyltransferase [Chlamydiota bacterium]